MKKNRLKKIYRMSLHDIAGSINGRLARLFVEKNRFTPGEASLMGKKIKYADGPSYLFMKKEIFENEIYKFSSSSQEPFIIDCGANIGLSVLYFKNIFPKSKITAFEPDPKIFSILKSNMNAYGYGDVQLLQKGLWDSPGKLKFFSEGADGGRIISGQEYAQAIEVETVRLSDYLDRQVDFLKIDIEGAETEVLEESRHKLKNVKNLFVEYHSFSDKAQSLDRILAILKEAGFRYYLHNMGIKSQQPFQKKEIYNNMDMQLNIFACRF
jgi:FkbM family methyltransferase